MSEWQPVMVGTAKLLLEREPQHYVGPDYDRYAGKIIMVRPALVSAECSAQRNFEIHPDYRAAMEDSRFICEHQILAD